jgi:hypothetical protein
MVLFKIEEGLSDKDELVGLCEPESSTWRNEGLVSGR